MVSRPTKDKGDQIPEASFEYELPNGCSVLVEFVPEGSGFFGNEGIPVRELYVNKDGKLVIEIGFKLECSCFKDSLNEARCTAAHGCEGDVSIPFKFEIEIDFLLPDRPPELKKKKEEFKKCLQSWTSTDATCVMQFKEYFKELWEHGAIGGEVKEAFDKEFTWYNLKNLLDQTASGDWKNPYLRAVYEAVGVILGEIKDAAPAAWDFVSLCMCLHQPPNDYNYYKDFAQNRIDEEIDLWNYVVRRYWFAAHQTLLSGDNSYIDDIAPFNIMREDYLTTKGLDRRP